MRIMTFETKVKMTHLARSSIFALALIFSTVQGNAQLCNPVPPKQQWSDAGQYVQTFMDYFKNIQDCDILGLIPKVDLSIGVKAYMEQCMEKNEVCPSPTPCGQYKSAQCSITGDVHGFIPTGTLGRSITKSGTNFGVKWTFSGKVGITIQITGTASGSFNYTQNCDNSYCAAGSLSGGGTVTPGGGGTVTFRYKHAGPGNWKSHFQALGITLEGPVPFTLTGERGWGTCSSETQFLKFCVGEIRPYIQISLPVIGSWQVQSPDAWYDGTPGCG